MSDPNLAPAAPAAALPFKNDGSFLEHFLKMSQGGQDAQASASSSTSGGDVKPANGQPEPTSKAAEAEGADKVMKDEKQQGSADEARPETPDAAEADHSSEGETKKPKPGPFAKFAKKGPFAGAVRARMAALLFSPPNAACARFQTAGHDLQQCAAFREAFSPDDTTTRTKFVAAVRFF